MQIIAHRGASGYAPENTRAAFDLALELRADGIETDVQLSRDGVLVLMHDATVDRTTNGTGRVAALDWSDLAALDAGSWHGERFAGERIPRLDGFLNRYVDQIQVCLEVKDPAGTEPVIRLLSERGLVAPGKLELTSFDWDTVTRLHEALPQLPVAFLTEAFGEALIEQVAKAGLAQICPQVSVVRPELVARAHQRGLTVRAWRVKGDEDIRRLHAAGVDGATSNWPDLRAG
ncbi:MAG: hypothetical protein HY329_25205 [Chloroflexi bacterium]|nr:hypothetical protein [Chloroflexota bacterium]